MCDILQYCTVRIQNADKKKNGAKMNGLPNGTVGTPTETDEGANGHHAIIKSSSIKDDFVLLPNGSAQTESGTLSVDTVDSSSKDFILPDVLDYVKAGVEAIIEDEVTQRFEAEQLKVKVHRVYSWTGITSIFLQSWNLLTRTNRRYQFVSRRLHFTWICGVFVRNCILLPLRVFICCLAVSKEAAETFILYELSYQLYHLQMLWLTLCTGFIGCWPEGQWKRSMYRRVTYYNDYLS